MNNESSDYYDLSALYGGCKAAFDVGSEAETEAIGAALARHMDAAHSAFVALSGELGAGKTAFVRGMASVLSPGSAVKSPTYTIVNEYRRGKTPLYHFDLYRISGPDDLYSIGYYDYLDRGICVAEWSERAGGELPSPRYDVKIVKTGENSRRITICRREG